MRLGRLLQRRFVVPTLIAAALGGTGILMYARASSGSSTQYRTSAATLGTVTQTLSLAGNLAPLGETDLDFAVSGRVTSVNMAAGQTAHAGDVLAALDTTTLQATLTQAQATLASAEARLSLDQAGPTAQSLAQTQASVNSAQVALQNAKTSLSDTQLVNQQSIDQAQNAVDAAASTVQTDKSNVASSCANSPPNPPSQQCTSDRQTLDKDTGAYNAAVNALNGTRVKAQQSNDQAQGQVNTAQVNLQNAQSSLAALQQGTTSQQIQMDQSQVQIDQVAVDNASRSLAEATLTAPTSGVVGTVNITVGQSVTGNGSSSSASSSAASASSSTSHQVTLLTPGAFQVSGTVTDAQVNQVAVGQRARVVAAGSAEAMNGKVSQISQVATITSGVATFSVTVTIDGTYPALRAGTSASISVIVNQVVHVVTVPSSAVQTSGGNSTVQVLVGGQPQTRTVQVGAADALRTEIVSGLSVGDQVVIATVTGTVPTNTGGGGLFGAGGAGGRGGGAGRGIGGG
ncbi:MAG TPA: biotin/lipoyl-binding protein [Candidatus Dormibacteraeota bacterium]|jgi:multidrug efflux pump subunit AcrA (membrane-fusion protein)|nr:biotin/lipoyl-binding protein [Candidatus Dormibacteraeota bacterium]